MAGAWKSQRVKRKPAYFHSKDAKKKEKGSPKHPKQVISKLEKVKTVHEVPSLARPLRCIVPAENLLVWGKCRGFGWWPGRIANHTELRGPIDPPDDPTRWIKWFGDGKFTETPVIEMAYFHDFMTFFKERSYDRNSMYRKAVDEAIMAAAKRAGNQKSLPAALLKWAQNSFYPEGYTKFLPRNLSADDLQGGMEDEDMDVETNEKEIAKTKIVKKYDDGKTLDFTKQLCWSLQKVREKVEDLESVCLGCGCIEIQSKHPLFVGGLCETCEVDYRESIYLLDGNGISCYCCVCGGGIEVLLCDNSDCCRCFCTSCMDLLAGKNTSQREKVKAPWLCFLCVDEAKHGLLLRRGDWLTNLQRFIGEGDQDLYCEILPIPPAPSPVERKAMRVLSLFDGIATGLLALTELGIEVDRYYSSEIDHEAMCVGEVRYPVLLKHVGDIKGVTDKQLLDWGPFDLVIGGSPCNDLSIVNPARKGIWSDKGSGNLFFEYLRVLHTCQLVAAAQQRRLFWMFENVVCMDHDSRRTIVHFLQRNPVLLDAIHVSPAHRPRCFWGNLPGMSRNIPRRPMVAAANHRLKLAECLEPGRKATTDKLRTITTNANSVSKRCVTGDVPEASLFGHAVVLQPRNQLDTLWITEIERIFGFPDHYTDVCNMSRAGRLRVLGKAWSVPVIKHLFAPLKDFFKCKG